MTKTAVQEANPNPGGPQLVRGTETTGAYPMIGQTISHYKITEKLGGGGMGVAW